MSAVATIAETVEGLAERVFMTLPERAYAADVRSAEEGLPLEDIARMVSSNVRTRRSPGDALTADNDGRRACFSTEEINETLLSNTGGSSAVSEGMYTLCEIDTGDFSAGVVDGE